MGFEKFFGGNTVKKELPQEPAPVEVAEDILKNEKLKKDIKGTREYYEFKAAWHPEELTEDDRKDWERLKNEKGAGKWKAVEGEFFNRWGFANITPDERVNLEALLEAPFTEGEVKRLSDIIDIQNKGEHKFNDDETFEFRVLSLKAEKAKVISAEF